MNRNLFGSVAHMSAFLEFLDWVRAHSAEEFLNMYYLHEQDRELGDAALSWDGVIYPGWRMWADSICPDYSWRSPEQWYEDMRRFADAR